MPDLGPERSGIPAKVAACPSQIASTSLFPYFLALCFLNSKSISNMFRSTSEKWSATSRDISLVTRLKKIGHEDHPPGWWIGLRGRLPDAQFIERPLRGLPPLRWAAACSLISYLSPIPSSAKIPTDRKSVRPLSGHVLLYAPPA